MEAPATSVRSGDIIASALFRQVLDRLGVLESGTQLLLGSIGLDTHTLVAVGSGFEEGGGIWLDGRSLTGKPVRGINLVVLDASLNVKYQGTYATADDPSSSIQMADDLVLRVAEGDIVVAVTHEVYATHLEANGKGALASIGGASMSEVTDTNSAAAFIGIVPSNPIEGFDYLVSVLPMDASTQLVGAPLAWGLYSSRLGAFLAGQAGMRPVPGAASGPIESPPVGSPPIAVPGAVITGVTVKGDKVATSTSGTGTVTLQGPAPPGGQRVTLSSLNPSVATVPASITVPEGQTSAPFLVTGVAPGSAVIIAATAGAAPRSASVTVVQELGITVVNFTPATATLNSTVTGSVTLNSAAPSGGITVSLSSDSPAIASVPGSVTIPGGQSIGSFPVTAGLAGTASITASVDGSTPQTAQLTVTPALALGALSLEPPSVQAGGTATGTVTLTGPAPAGGATVVLASNNPQVARVQPSITITPGGSTASFTISAAGIGTAVITATLAGSAPQSAPLAVAPAFALAPLQLAASTAVGGTQVTGTVTLNTAAPADGITVSLSSDNVQVATVPGSVTVPAGQTSTNFTVTVVSAGTSTITATLPGTPSQSAPLAVLGLAPLALSSPTVAAGGMVTGTLTLTGPAPAGGISVALSSSDGTVASIQASITILPGVSSTTFTVTGGNAGTATISASLPGSPTQSATLTVRPVLASLQFASTSMVSGATIQGTVGLTGPAPSGGATAALTSDNPLAVSVPSSITIQGGSATSNFNATGGSAGSATITAALPDSSVHSTPLTVTPAVASLTLSSSIVTSQSQVTGTVALNTAAPPGGTAITLSSANLQVAPVPASVTVPPGQTATTFTFVAGIAGATTITASLPGSSSQPVQLTVRAPKVGKEHKDNPDKVGTKDKEGLREKLIDSPTNKVLRDGIGRASASPSGEFGPNLEADGNSPSMHRAFIRPQERPPVGQHTLDELSGGAHAP